MVMIMKLTIMETKTVESEVLAETQRRGKVKRTKSETQGIMVTFSKTRVDIIPMDINTIVAVFDISEDGFGKRSIFGEADK